MIGDIKVDTRLSSPTSYYAIPRETGTRYRDKEFYGYVTSDRCDDCIPLLSYNLLASLSPVQLAGLLLKLNEIVGGNQVRIYTNMSSVKLYNMDLYVLPEEQNEIHTKVTLNAIREWNTIMDREEELTSTVVYKVVDFFVRSKPVVIYKRIDTTRYYDLIFTRMYSNLHAGISNYIDFGQQLKRFFVRGVGLDENAINEEVKKWNYKLIRHKRE